MILSMTGYGRSESQSESLILTLEIRTVNSRFLDFSPRLPKSLMQFEDEAYKIVKKSCERGRVSLSANIEYLNNLNKEIILNKEKLKQYLDVFKEIEMISNIPNALSINDIMKIPDILLKWELEDDSKLKEMFLSTLNIALNEVENNRIDEGCYIKKDLLMRLDLILDFVKKIKEISVLNLDESLNKYKQKIQIIVSDVSLDESRLYQEIAMLAEKKDITEELVRLESHIVLFKKFMNSENNKGKKLNFLIQEMGREINTIGSKTDELKISHMAVELKDELEKIREQVQNIV